MSHFFETFLGGSTVQAVCIAALILFFGFRLLVNLTPANPLSAYAIQIFALILILPVVLTLALTEKFSAEATTGILGTIIGFFFGGALQSRKAASGQQGGTTDG
jgi:amino acid permease